MTTIKDLCQVVTYEDIQRALNYHYPIDENDYTTCFEFLKTAVIEDETNSKEELILSVSRYSYDDVDISDDEYYSIHTWNHGEKYFNGEEYSVSFRPWGDLANIKISKTTLENNHYEEIVAHFIWEITWYGDQEQTRKIRDELNESVANIKLELKEKEIKFSPLRSDQNRPHRMPWEEAK